MGMRKSATSQEKGNALFDDSGASSPPSHHKRMHRRPFRVQALRLRHLRHSSTQHIAAHLSNVLTYSSSSGPYLSMTFSI
eukprot:747437-Rhodomonas_salina.1